MRFSISRGKTNKIPNHSVRKNLKDEKNVLCITKYRYRLDENVLARNVLRHDSYSRCLDEFSEPCKTTHGVFPNPFIL